MKTRQTDSSHFETKVLLRAEHLPEGCVRVLDCYGGTGRIWNEVFRRCPDRDIQVLRIDTKPGRGGLYLRGDNRKYLAGMDLSTFNVIDLDAYGVPFAQLEIIFRKLRTRSMVFVTFIQAVSGQLPWGMLELLGYPRRMIAKSPILFSRRGLDKFKAYLALRGVEQINRCSYSRKHYLCFDYQVPESADVTQK